MSIYSKKKKGAQCDKGRKSENEYSKTHEEIIIKGKDWAEQAPFSFCSM